MLKQIRTLNIERFIAGVLVVFALVELYGATQLSVAEEFTLGPGALPIIYSLGVVMFAGILFIWPTKKAPPLIQNPVMSEGDAGREEALPTPNYRAGALTFAFIAVLIASIYFLGFFAGASIFSFLYTRFITRWPLAKAIAFALIWGGALFYTFDHVLEVQLEPGVLFGS